MGEKAGVKVETLLGVSVKTGAESGVTVDIEATAVRSGFSLDWGSAVRVAATRVAMVSTLSAVDSVFWGRQPVKKITINPRSSRFFMLLILRNTAVCDVSIVTDACA